MRHNPHFTILHYANHPKYRTYPIHSQQEGTYHRGRVGNTPNKEQLPWPQSKIAVHLVT